jgi:hypothetical protein
VFCNVWKILTGSECDAVGSTRVFDNVSRRWELRTFFVLYVRIKKTTSCTIQMQHYGKQWMVKQRMSFLKLWFVKVSSSQDRSIPGERMCKSVHAAFRQCTVCTIHSTNLYSPLLKVTVYHHPCWIVKQLLQELTRRWARLDGLCARTGSNYITTPLDEITYW